MMILGSAYVEWLCDVLLFELRTGLSGVFARGGRTKQREFVPRGMAPLALCGSGAFGGSVWSEVTN